MPQPVSRHVILSETAPKDSESGDLRVVIETPKGSRNKFKYDPQCDCFELGFALPEGMLFPYDFGFIPSTIGDDGDPLDILVLMDSPGIPGCVVRARLIGVIEAKQKEKRGGWVKNDRLIAVATHAQLHETTKSLGDLRPHLVEEIKEFFVNYNELRGRKFKPLGEHGPKRAQLLVDEGIAALEKQRRDKAA
jgi:inorganic pyrophosphatase